MSEKEVSDIIDLFLHALECEVREARSAGREYRLSGGRRTSAEQGRYVYSFEVKHQPILRDDTVCSVSIGQRKVIGSVLSMSEESILLVFDEDLGQQIDSAVVKSDETSLIRALGEGLNNLRDLGSNAGWNHNLASQAISGGSNTIADPGALPFPRPDDLTDDQHRALEAVLSNSVTYLWGPPGTGKTVTLSALAWCLFTTMRRTLIVSHTNRAADGVVEGLCRRISERGRISLPENSVLRLGTLSRQSLRDSFGEQIDFERCLVRSEHKVVSRLAFLKQDLTKTIDEISSLSKDIELWRSREDLQIELDKVRPAQPESSGPMRQIFGRVFGLGARASDHDATPDGTAREAAAFLEARLAEISTMIKAASKDQLEEQVIELRNRESELSTGIAQLERLLREMRSKTLGTARIVATTATQAFLRVKELDDFDTVIIDEASMIPLPLLYLLSGMGKRRVVIAGDFRQLPPISHSKAEVAKLWYARDIFDASGVIESVTSGSPKPNLVKLTTQFRSNEILCSLINKRFYGGDLKTKYSDPDPIQFPSDLEYLRDHPVVLIDSSDLSPVGQNVGRSKANLFHALVIRRLCLRLPHLIGPNGEAPFGVISPYRAQSDLIEELFKEAAIPEVAIGTVHRFQGEERKLIILDLTESNPLALGSFLTAQTLSDEGARLLNVALSRAQSNLIVVANMRYLRERARPNYILNGILDDLEGVAHKISAQEALTPLSYDQVSSVRPEAARALAFQCFDRSSFGSAIVADIQEASKEVVIVSAIISPKQVALLLDLFMEKVQSGVKFTVVVPTVDENSGASAASHKQACGLLTRMGMQVIERRLIHTRLVCIDGEVVWHGSLNPLSFSEDDNGLMTRTVSATACSAILDGFFTAPGSKRIQSRSTPKDPTLSVVGE